LRRRWRESRLRGITVTSSPRIIDTDHDTGRREKAQGAWAAQIPLGRLGTVDDRRAAACFCVG